MLVEHFELIVSSRLFLWVSCCSFRAANLHFISTCVAFFSFSAIIFSFSANRSMTCRACSLTKRSNAVCLEDVLASKKQPCWGAAIHSARRWEVSSTISIRYCLICVSSWFYKRSVYRYYHSLYMNYTSFIFRSIFDSDSVWTACFPSTAAADLHSDIMEETPWNNRSLCDKVTICSDKTMKCRIKIFVVHLCIYSMKYEHLLL